MNDEQKEAELRILSGELLTGLFRKERINKIKVRR